MVIDARLGPSGCVETLALQAYEVPGMEWLSFINVGDLKPVPRGEMAGHLRPQEITLWVGDHGG